MWNHAHPSIRGMPSFVDMMYVLSRWYIVTSANDASDQETPAVIVVRRTNAMLDVVGSDIVCCAMQESAWFRRRPKAHTPEVAHPTMNTFFPRWSFAVLC